MLKDLLFYNFACFVVSLAPMLFLGHRVKTTHWAFSLVYLCVLAFLGYCSVAIFASNPPPQTAILLQLSIGIIIIASNENWNSIGHGVFWALINGVGTLLMFAAYVTFNSHLGPWSLILSTFLLSLQLICMVLMIVHTFEILDVICRTRWHHVVEPESKNDFFPKVSLHVPAHNEPPEMVNATLSALAQLRYPNYEIIMVDDNTNDESLWRPVEEHCKTLGIKFFHLDNWPGYKSGALNFALSKTDPDAEIVGVVDSDYIVKKKFLSDLVGLFKDPKVAFVQTPQDYRDFDRTETYSKSCYDAYRYFFSVSMPSRNEHNGIICAGTMGLVRRSTVAELGGWDEWCITEDAELSLRILHMGYKGVFVDRSYGQGLMPLDYDGLRKQRFRWAFGGMQILRLHWRKLIPRWLGGDPKSQMAWEQKFAYLSGGLQWLNDPLSFVFTLILFVGVGALSTQGTLIIQPMVASMLFFPMGFLIFSLLRFLWALKIRQGGSLRDSYGALTILLGLTWVVTLACFQGLVRREGVFLRTPKKRENESLLSGLLQVRSETVLATLCVIGISALIFIDIPKLVRLQLISLFVWQLFIYSSAMQSWIWSYQDLKNRGGMPQVLPFRTAGHRLGVFVAESGSAIHICVGTLFFVLLLLVSVTRSSELEKIFSILPQYAYVSQVQKPPGSIEIKALVYREEQAVLRSNVSEALSLWSNQGFIRDVNFTPQDPSDDRIWAGEVNLRKRYTDEFSQRTYQQISHKHLSVKIGGNNAQARNDLDATIRTELATQRVVRVASDLWTFRKENGKWKIYSLILNNTDAEKADDPHLAKSD